MNILLADSDRDFLQAYQKLLEMEGHAVTAAFDGVQVVSLLDAKPFDLCILEESLPRIEHEEMLKFLKNEGVPAIVLADGKVTVKTLLRPILPNAYLSFPFLPADLLNLMQAVKEKAKSGETVCCQGVGVDVAGFCLSGSKVPLTNGEIDLLLALESPRKAAGHKTRVMIQALNEKFRRAGKQTRIIYEMEKGYRLVSDHG